MKKILTTALAIGMGIFVLAPMATAKSANTKFDLPNGTHVKVDICHNVDHNPHIVPVSINAADYPYSTAHGELVLNSALSVVSFAPHTGTGGHEHDSVVRVYTKHGNTEVNTWTSGIPCTSTPTDQSPVTAFVCFDGDISTFGPATAEDVTADVAAFIADNEGAVEVASADAECLVPEIPEVPETPVTPDVPAVVTPETPQVVVVDQPAAPGAPLAAAPVVPVKLPHTV